MKFASKATVCEVGPRDGVQNLPPLNVPDKVKLLDLIVDAGIKEIEVGSFLGDNPDLGIGMVNTPEVFRTMNRRPGVIYRALLQTPIGAQQAADNGCEKIKLNISGSVKHYELMSGKTIKEGMAGFAEIGSISAKNNIAILGSISLAFVSPYDGLIPSKDIKEIIQNFIDCGATEISLNDTAGMATPKLVYERFCEMISAFPAVTAWAFHPHNTRGMALANIVAALEAGMTKVDSSLAGTGGCPVFKNASGNIATEDMLYMLDGMGVETGVNLEKAIAAGEFLEELVNHNGIDSYIQRLEKIKRKEKDVE